MGCLQQDLTAWRAFLSGAQGHAALSRLYPGLATPGLATPGLATPGLATPGLVATQRERYLRAAECFLQAFGQRAFAFLSAPGRTELLGNHTDHQRGRVLAAAVSMDMLGVASKNGLGSIRMLSEGYGERMDVSLDALRPVPAEANTTAALIRGVAAGIKEAGGSIGGLDMYVTSNVPRGSGLSSSAAVEVLIGTALNALYNDMQIPPVAIAQIGQRAENEYFGKPCGLMDQIACATGGVVSIDFLDKDSPAVEEIPCHMDGYTICIVNAGGSHANLTEEYASMPLEMRAVAEALGCEVLGEADPAAFFSAIPALRGQVSDRAILRAMHFFDENERVLRQKRALLRGDWALYRQIMQESGDSSFMLLQNIYPSNNTRERSVALALALSARLLRGRGAWRVHGGGMAGTIQCFLPDALAGAFQAEMEAVFGGGCCYTLSVRPVGGHCL